MTTVCITSELFSKNPTVKSFDTDIAIAGNFVFTVQNTNAISVVHDFNFQQTFHFSKNDRSIEIAHVSQQ